MLSTTVAISVATCTQCGEEKELTEFNKDAKTLSGVRAICRVCSQNQDRAYRYGLSVVDYETLLAAQLYVCAVCDDPFTEDNVPCVDHDHKCCPGRVGCGRCNRGLLCARCNKVLGAFEDDPDLFERAVIYLGRGVTYSHGEY